MAYITAIGSAPGQVEYRLGAAHGCKRAEAAETQFSYHADGRERPLVWTGAGLGEVGIEAGTVLDEAQFDAARALMSGVDPRSGERLVSPKLAVYEDAKVPLGPLVRAIQAAAAQRGVEPEALISSLKLAKVFGRARRAVARSGEGALLRADEAGQLADSAGLDVATVWGTEAYAAAVANLTETTVADGADGRMVEVVEPRRRVVGNFGYDVSFTLPKSHSLLLAFADEDTAAGVEKVYQSKVSETFDWLESQTAYGMRGKHGGGHVAETVPGSGFLGWSMVHRAARPVGDRVIGDPHWHVHITIANLTKGLDGQWSTVAAGGRDLMRHAPAVDHILKALVRRQLGDEFGVEFARSQRTGAWEVASIPDATLQAFSKRGASIEAMLVDLGFDPALATRRAEDLAAAQTRHDKTHATGAPDETLRSMWQQEARELGADPDQLAVNALLRVPVEPGTAAAQGRAESLSETSVRYEPWAQQFGYQPRGPFLGDANGDALEVGAMQEGDHIQKPLDAAALERLKLRGVVARVLSPEHGLTFSMRRFTRVEALAAVADAVPQGAADLAEIERLTDQALTDAGIVALPEKQANLGAVAAQNGGRHQIAAGHMANAARFTTADVVEAESVILAAAAASRDGQGAVRVSVQTATLARGAVEVGQGFELSVEQAEIVEQLVTSGRQLDAVLGPPGTGKTTLMRAARAAWEAGGYTVGGAATAAVAAQNLATESGIKSQTVAQWVWSIQDAAGARECVANGYVPVWDVGGEPLGDSEQRRVDRAARFGGLVGVDVFVLDEANLTDDRDRAVLYTEARRTGTKVVEVGDPLQLRGVGCGSLFGRVHELVDGGALTANRRQSDEDERAAIAAWRTGRYAHALTSWSQRGRLVATETGDQALTAMVATWMTERAGAPDAHAEMRGVVMLAASNASVDRLNDAAQAVRAASGELGPERSYEAKAGSTVRLRKGDHVLIRLNDRTERMHEGPDVLNGYRGVVEGINSDGGVRVAWQSQTDDGYQTKEATLSPAYIAAGGVSLGYAMTGHKAEGLTVAADWESPDGVHQGGTVLVYAPGMDEPGMHVATSRHKDKMFMFAGRDQVESTNATHERGVPDTDTGRDHRVIAALAEQAEARSTNANDTPVHDDLGTGPHRPARPHRPAPAREAAAAWRDLRAPQPVATPTPPTTTEDAVSRYSFAVEQENWHVGWNPTAATYYAQVEPLISSATSEAALVNVAGDRPGEVPTLVELDQRLEGRVQLPDSVREQLAHDQGAPELVGSRLGAAERLSALEERELTARWAALSGRVGPSAGASQSRTAVTAAAREAKEAAEREARRRETARREDDARHREQGRGPHM